MMLSNASSPSSPEGPDRIGFELYNLKPPPFRRWSIHLTPGPNLGNPVHINLQ